jgi:hypothetical protein
MLLEPKTLIADWSNKRWVQLVIATLLALVHLFAFSLAADSRLDIPFNLAPDAHLAFTDPAADSLGTLPREPPHWSRLAVSRFDAQHYIGHALRGLDACQDDPDLATGRDYLACGLGWLPGYGVIGGWISDLTGLEPDITLTAMSVIAAIILNLIWICPTMIARFGRFEAFATLIAWNCYPAAWNLVVPATESLVLALGIGGFVMLMKERWVWSAVLIGAATAFRLPTASFAFALGCCLLLATRDRYKARVPKWWKPLVAIPLCGWGQFLTMAIFQIELDNWHAFFDARFTFGDHNRLGRLLDVQYFLKGFQSQCCDMLVYTALLVIIALTGRRVLARAGRIPAVFLVITTLFTAITAIAGAMQYWGITRYMMLCPLAFLGMGRLARSHRAVFVMWLILAVAIYWNFELCSYISQGDPDACPCLGHSELHLYWTS